MKRVLVLSLVIVMSVQVLAGSLEPSAGPGSTMKTLDEVEPRIVINSVNTPGVTSYEYVISSSGSYYLTGDVTTTKGGIHVDADDVTVDLMGYTLTGPDMATNHGINIFGRQNVEIRNGTVRDFHDGIFDGNLGQGNRVIGVRAMSNVRSGIYINSYNSLVKDCLVSGNGSAATAAAYGIYVGKGGSVINNIVCNNGDDAVATGNGVHGISAGSGSTVTGNTVHENGTSAEAQVRGIYGGTGSLVSGNVVFDNGDSTTGGYKVQGIYVPWGCTVTGNSSYSNGTGASGDVYGIYMTSNCLVDQNTAYDNGAGAGSATNMNSPASCTFGTNHAP